MYKNQCGAQLILITTGLEYKTCHSYNSFFHAHLKHFELIAMWLEIIHVGESVSESYFGLIKVA